MGKMIAYKLMPRTSFHIGARGIGIERTSDVIHSDTLFSAIVSAWRYLGAEMDGDGNMKLLEPFFAEPEQPPFKLSSALPFAGDTLLYPAPLVKHGSDKAVKKAEFLSEKVLLSCDIESSEKMQGGKVRLTKEEKNGILGSRSDCDDEGIWKSGEKAVVPRVTIDRISSASQIYHCGELHFAKDCGLYFIVELRDEEYEGHVERAVDFLSEEGIGGERSSGCGQFEYQKCPNSKPAASDGDVRYMTLSLYHPTRSEVEGGVLSDAAYNLVDSKGWIHSPDGSSHRRRSVWMITEGSVFSQPVSGDIVDVRPCDWHHHPVYRSGMALTMPISAQWEGNDG